MTKRKMVHGKKPRRIRNPRGSRFVQIAPKVDAVLYSFGNQPHLDCDKECKESGHRYQHTFDKKFPLVWDTETGNLII